MLNKELLMVGNKDLEPVLSIYISPDIGYMPSVSGTLSSGQPFDVCKAGETTFKFSEIELTANIRIKYDSDGLTHLSTTNLTQYGERPFRKVSRAPSIMVEVLHVADPSQSASISISRS